MTSTNFGKQLDAVLKLVEQLRQIEENSLGAALKRALQEKETPAPQRLLLDFHRRLYVITEEAIVLLVGDTPINRLVRPAVAQVAAQYGIESMDQLMRKSITQLDATGVDEQTLVSLLRMLNRRKEFPSKVIPDELRKDYPHEPLYLAGYLISRTRNFNRGKRRRNSPQ